VTRYDRLTCCKGVPRGLYSDPHSGAMALVNVPRQSALFGFHPPVRRQIFHCKNIFVGLWLHAEISMRVLQQLTTNRLAVYVWSAVATVVVLLMLIMQLRLLGLGNAKPITSGPTSMFNFASAAAKDIDGFYRALAERTLNIPPSPLPTDSAMLRHWRESHLEGIRLLFSIRFDRGGNPRITFYNPQHDFSQENPPDRDAYSVREVCTPWIEMYRHNISLTDSSLRVVEQNREAPVVLKPIIDPANRLQGLVGLVPDSRFLAERLIPRIIQQNIERFFPIIGREDVIVSAADGKQRQIYLNEAGKGLGSEISRPLSFAFTGWEVKIQNRTRPPLQWSRQQYALALLLTILATIIIVTGIFLMLKANLRAMSLSRMKAAFAANVSHELRTPLCSIRVFAEFLKLGRITEIEQVRKYGEHIESESQRLTHLIGQILDFSAMESGRQQYHPERTDLNQLVAETMGAVEPELLQNGFHINYQTTPEPLPSVMIDKDAISEVLINILDNAAKYSTLHKEVSIRLAHERGFITLAVTDCGIGLSQEHKEKIFDEFYRVNNGLVHNVRGNGLGLAIAKRIVAFHRGKITVESEPGQGSTFTVFIPVGV